MVGSSAIRKSSAKKSPAKKLAAKKRSISAKKVAKKPSAKKVVKKTAKKTTVKKTKKALKPKKTLKKKTKKAKKVVKKVVKKILTKVQKRRLARKTKGTPKRATSAFIFFSMANRSKVQKQFNLANNQMPEISRKLGMAWAQLSAQARKPYEQEAAKDSARAQRERKSFLAKQVKKPCSAYIFFAVDNRQAIMKANKLASSDITQVARKTGEAWKKLSANARVVFQKRADEDKARYQRAMTTKAASPRK